MYSTDPDRRLREANAEIMRLRETLAEIAKGRWVDDEGRAVATREAGIAIAALGQPPGKAD